MARQELTVDGWGRKLEAASHFQPLISFFLLFWLLFFFNSFYYFPPFPDRKEVKNKKQKSDRSGREAGYAQSSLLLFQIGERVGFSGPPSPPLSTISIPSLGERSGGLLAARLRLDTTLFLPFWE